MKIFLFLPALQSVCESVLEFVTEEIKQSTPLLCLSAYCVVAKIWNRCPFELSLYSFRNVNYRKQKVQRQEKAHDVTHWASTLDFI